MEKVFTNYGGVSMASIGYIFQVGLNWSTGTSMLLYYRTVGALRLFLLYALILILKASYPNQWPRYDANKVDVILKSQFVARRIANRPSFECAGLTYYSKRSDSNIVL